MNNVLFTNGSDEILDYAFRAFCGPESPAAFADVTYGFYKVFAQIHGVPYTEVPLREDFSLALSDYDGVPGTVFIANPNAPTGMALARAEIEAFVSANPDRVIVVDEAYVDFGAESAVLMDVQTGAVLYANSASAYYPVPEPEYDYR